MNERYARKQNIHSTCSVKLFGYSILFYCTYRNNNSERISYRKYNCL